MIEDVNDLKEKSFKYALDPNNVIQTINIGCSICGESISFLFA